MSMRYALIAGAAALLLVAGCGGNGKSNEGSTGTPKQTFTISETDFELSPANVTIDEAGTYEFTATNDGGTQHALEIEGSGVEAETDTLDPGQSGSVTVDLEPGTYEMYCPVDGHRDQGMEGAISVGGAQQGTETTETTETTDTDESGSSGGYGG